jgi:hypothetical protein
VTRWGWKERTIKTFWPHWIINSHAVQCGGSDSIPIWGTAVAIIQAVICDPEVFRMFAGRDVTLGFGSYQVTELPPCNPSTNCQYEAAFSSDCSGVIHPDETKTCTITNTFIPLG